MSLSALQLPPALPAQPRIGLLGGSFDPPHLAHLALGQVAQASLGLHQLRWLPAGAPWQKSGRALAPAAQRAEMLQALVAGLPGSVVDECELNRQGPTYTIDTVLQLQTHGPADAQWFLVIGQDQYARLGTWHRWHELLQRVTLAVAARDGQAPQSSPEVSATPHRLVTLPLPRTDISASDIRARCARGEPVAALVGENVARYIAQHRLYTQASPHPGPNVGSNQAEPGPEANRH